VNPQDPLANLHPLRDPQMISWWPLAPGWWILILVAIITTIGLGYWLTRRYRGNAYRRQALQQLDQLHRELQAGGNSSEFATQVNALLKRVALTAYPGDEVASRHSESWQSFLNQQLQADVQFQDDFATAAYRKNCPELNSSQLQQAATHWIKQHRRAA
jgi:hypothetical protein